MNLFRLSVGLAAIGATVFLTGAFVLSTPVKESPDPKPPVSAPAPVPLPVPQSTPKATLKGTVKIKGAIPRPRKIRTTADPKCAGVHRGPLYSEDVVADSRGGVLWAFVYVKKGLEGKTFEVPKKPVILTQKGCKFVPHAFGIMVGQELRIQNGDPLMHIVHVRPDSNEEWGFSQDRPGDQRTKVFTSKEVMIRVFCDVHTWMSAYAGVLDHPFHAVTVRGGKYQIKDIPPGKYTIEVWHEKYKSVEQEVELKNRRTATLDFTLEETK